jgi:hypothetical protein
LKRNLSFAPICLGVNKLVSSANRETIAISENGHNNSCVVCVCVCVCFCVPAFLEILNRYNFKMKTET